jgi:hypothetical protein
MSAHRTQATFDQDGKLVLEDLPFRAGDVVEVIIVESNTRPNGNNSYPLRGTVTNYDAPTDPVGIESWDALQ